MRRTTKILIGIISGIFILSIGLIIGLSFTDLKESRTTYQEESNIPQDEKDTIELDDHQVICLEEVFTAEDIYWDTYQGSLTIKPTSANDGKTGLTIPRALKEYLDFQTVNDTLYIRLLTDSLLEAHKNPEKENRHPIVTGVNLVIYMDVLKIKNRLDLDLCFAYNQSDSLVIESEQNLTMRNISADHVELLIHSNKQLLLKDCHFNVMDMNLDNMGSWTSENSRVEVLNVTGSRPHSFRMSDKEIGRIHWNPANKDASLNLILASDTTEVIFP